MNLRNLLTLTIRAEDYNLAAERLGFLARLRRLTLNPYSGMNYELNNFERIRKQRRVACQVLTAYRSGELVGWAMMSKEPTDYGFNNSPNGFHPKDGILFEIFIHPNFRHQGIGSELIKVARRKAHGSRLCICPHDSISRRFYVNFENFGNKEM